MKVPGLAIAFRLPLRWLPLALSVVGILAATLTLAPRPHRQGLPVVCLWCADTALADDLRNLILFLPLGAALASFGRTTRQATLLGGVLALCVELAQARYSGDILP